MSKVIQFPNKDDKILDDIATTLQLAGRQLDELSSDINSNEIFRAIESALYYVQINKRSEI